MWGNRGRAPCTVEDYICLLCVCNKMCQIYLFTYFTPLALVQNAQGASQVYFKCQECLPVCLKLALHLRCKG